VRYCEVCDADYDDSVGLCPHLIEVEFFLPTIVDLDCVNELLEDAMSDLVWCTLYNPTMES